MTEEFLFQARPRVGDVLLGEVFGLLLIALTTGVQNRFMFHMHI